MQKAAKVLSIINERGKKGLPIERVYRLLFNEELYLMAYQNLYANDGAMTKGSNDDTVDGMSIEKIKTIIKAIKDEKYVWTPVRRTYIDKKNSNKKRPLGLPSWSDKVVQEVIRLILDAYYDPQFSDKSHGFRENKGCQSALEAIKFKDGWKSVKWFVEGDIKGCFDNIDHDTLLTILQEKVHDNRLIRLIAHLLKAGYMENWKYNETLSGCPQGGVLSPLLSNIYMDKLDKFVETTLIPRYTRGGRRKPSKEYQEIQKFIMRHQRRGEWDKVEELKKQAQTIPSKDTHDPDFRRLYYIRYADDWLMGFSGPKVEAESIKQEVAKFLNDELKLTLSKEKTLITHGRNEFARFLGYDIHVLHSDTQHDSRGQRSINGVIGFRVPREVMKNKMNQYMKQGKPWHRKELAELSDFDIISRYQSEFRGFVQYYMMAYNAHQMWEVKSVMENSLMKTLANKFRSTVTKMYKKYRTIKKFDKKEHKIIQVTVEREGKKKPLVAQFGGIELKHQKTAKIEDVPVKIFTVRSELVERLLRNTCELCGSPEKVQMHHVRKLKDLEKKHKDQPEWVKRMIAIRRKSLAVCEKCHIEIHAGRYDKKKVR